MNICFGETRSNDFSLVLINISGYSFLAYRSEKEKAN